MFSGRVNPRIAIVGAGIAGLALSSLLAAHARITLFEKSRGIGGRMTTRRAEPWTFDHGTQFFTARNPDFRAFLAPLLDTGTVREWEGRVVYLEAGQRPRKRLWFEPHYIASPSMNAVCKHLAAGLDIRTATEVAPLGERGPSGWSLQDTSGKDLGEFDAVVCTAPAPQAARLLDRHLPADAALRGVRYRACLALMLGLDPTSEPDWIAGKARDNPIEWIAAQSSRPGRSTACALVAHASADWSDANLERPIADLEREMLDAVLALTGVSDGAVKQVSLHRWRYALADVDTAADTPWVDIGAGLAATGDWCRASRVEDAWLAGRTLAEQLLDQRDGR